MSKTQVAFTERSRGASPERVGKAPRSRSSLGPTDSSSEVIGELGRFFRRNGYVRRQNPKRLKRDGYMGYKKGDEVRLTAHDEQELQTIRELLTRAGFRPGRPFVKGRQFRQPVYGREAVRQFLRLVKGGGRAKSGRLKG